MPLLTIQSRRIPPRVFHSLGIDALLVTHPTNILYLTGVHCSIGRLLLEPRRKRLFVDSRYFESAKSSLSLGVEVQDVSAFQESIQNVTRIGCEASHLSLASFRRLQSILKNKKIVQTIDLVEGLRRKKDPVELSKIRRAIRLTNSVLRSIPSLLVVGITERQLAAEIGYRCALKAASGMAFPTIVAFGEHTSRPHHVPTNRPLQMGDLVQVDSGATYDGYASDCSRVLMFGRWKPEYIKAYRALKEAKKSAENLLRPGASISSLDQAARAVLKHYGMESAFTHSLGHGLGLDIHEAPSISSRDPKARLRRGDVITIEPGVYFEGKFGMRLEDTHCIV